MHIGLIGGIGPASTWHYYRALVGAHVAAGRRLSLTIAHADLAEMVRNMNAGAAQAQAVVFAGLIDQLRAGGCEAAALTSMGGHFCIAELRKISSLPLIDAVEALDAHFAASGYHRVGVLGTSMVMDSGLYGVTSAEVIAPRAAVRAAVHDTYSRLAAAAAADAGQRAFFEREALALCEDGGAEVIALGGTDLFLAFDGPHYPYPIADCALIHAEAIARVAVDGMAAPARAP